MPSIFNSLKSSRNNHLAWLLQTNRSHFYSNSLPIIKTIDDETEVKVQVGIGRQVHLRIRHPPRPEANSPIVIFLQHAIPRMRERPSCLRELALGANATAVQVNICLSRRNGYPIPVHMVLAAYDWVLKHLDRGRTVCDEMRTTTKHSKIGVCGELIGGSLAAMLALTECHYTPSEFEPQGITAAVVGNPILDWTSLFPSDPFLHVSKTGFFPEEANFSKVSVNEALSIDSLCVIRQQFFSKAEKYFDPFASPLLFFRTPSSDTPNETVTSLTNQSFNDALIEDGTMPFPVKKRHSLRKHPPVNSDLVLPSTRVDVGKDFAAKNQAIEFVDLMRKSFRRSEVEREGLAGISVKRRFEVIERDGMDLWDAKRMLEVGQWFSEVLRQP